MRVTVLGGAGFIGSNLVDRLINSENASVVVVDNLSSGTEEDVNPRALFKNLDVLNSRKLSGFIRGSDAVINCVGTTSIQLNDSINVNLNIKAACSISEALLMSGVTRLINVSDAYVYGKGSYGMLPTSEDSVSISSPNCVYAVSKLSGEMIFNSLTHHGVRVINTRPTVVCGKRQKYGNSFSVFLKHSVDRKVFSVFNEGLVERDYIHIDDVSEMLVEVLKNIDRYTNTAFNLGTGSSWCSANLAAVMAQKFMSDFLREDIPIFETSKYTGVLRRPDYVLSMRASPRKISEELGVLPRRRLHTIVSDTASWYINNRVRWEK